MPSTIKMLLFLALFGLSPLVAASEKPNVLFIAVDDLNDWVGVLGGHPQAQTPNIDRLAKRSVLFTRAYCSGPSCNASRASLLLGLRPSTTGIYSNGHDWRKPPSLQEAVSLPKLFKQSGYRTLGCGKLFHAHTFFNEKSLKGYYDASAWSDYYPSIKQQLPEEVRPEEWPVHGSEEFYRGHFDWSPLDVDDSNMADTKVVAWAKEQLAQESDEPLFLAVGIYRPHLPWYVPREYYERFPLEQIQLPHCLEEDLEDIPEPGKKMARRKWHTWVTENNHWPAAVQAYLASMAYADQQIGDLVSALDSSKHAENTIIILWSDHGYHLGEKESWEKFALWEDTTHVPLLIFDPRSPNPKAKHESPVSLLDLYPTLIELCQLDNPPQVLEGTSLVETLSSPSTLTGRAVITTQGKSNHSVRSLDFRYIRYADGSEELYDHRSDPNEWHNLANDSGYEKIKARLGTHLPTTNADPLKKSTSKEDKESPKSEHSSSDQ